VTPPPQIRSVLMTADTVGGVWTYALELIAGFAAHGVQVILATMGAALEPHQAAELARFGDAVELQESNFRLEWMEEPWSDVAAAGEWLLAIERERRPDVVHLNGYAHAALPFAAPRLVVAHSCVVSWWHAVKGGPPPKSWARYQTAVRLGLDSADMVVAPSHAMLAALARHYGLSGETRAIYNGRGWPSHAAPASPKKPFILSVGRLWDEAKNAATLAAAAAKLPWPVRIAGDTRAPHGTETVLPNVELLGRRSAAELVDAYRRAAIYALPARYEPFGLSVLEAALGGCALVLGDIASLRELWSGAALFVPPDDPDALRATLLELIVNPYRRKALGADALQRARRFSTGRMAAAYLSTYAELLSRTPRTADAGALAPSFA
jgi:glycosyltransferase involved in cell wall biosynthesis